MAKEIALVEQNDMVARFDALRARIGQGTTSDAISIRERLDARLLQHIEYRATELIDAVLA
jgi:hypothetical protein